MEQLSGLDGAFLAMETRAVFGHVGSICIVDPSTAQEPLTLDRLTKVLASRLPLAPLLRRRLVTVPLGLDQPYWIDDPDFDIEFHVRELTLPAPGDDNQLAEQVAKLHGRPLDRSRPLWELYLIPGLSNGRAAIYSKIHHAAVDGVSGGDLLGAVLDPRPEGRRMPDPAPFEGEAEPSTGWVLARSVVTLATHPLRAVRVATGVVKSVPALREVLRTPPASLIAGGPAGGDDPGAVLPQPRLRAPSTPFNAPISPHRQLAFADLSLSEVKKVRTVPGMTVNDVVLALCAGALRRWLDYHGVLPAAPLVAAIPVSVRSSDQRGSFGNRISMMFAALPTHLPDAHLRLTATHQALRAAKEQHGAIPASLLADVSEFAMPALANQAWRLAARLRLLEWVNPFNLFISNVPGPRVPLYFAGARLLAYYPVSAIADGQGLNITVMSYQDTLHFGLVACRELMPDLDLLAGYLVEELAVLAAPSA